MAIESAGSEGLKAYGEKCTAELNKIVNLVRVVHWHVGWFGRGSRGGIQPLPSLVPH